MNSRRHLFLTISLLFLVLFVNAQPKNNNDLFEFIEPTSDNSALKFIQTFNYSSKKGEDIASLYETIKDQAQDKGSNCFNFNDFIRDSVGRMTLILDAYYGEDEFIEYNFNNHEKNTLYIISDGDFSNKRYSFSVNKEKKLLKSGAYYKHEIKVDQKVKVNMGGFFGTTITIAWEQNRQCKFYSLSGFGLANNAFRPAYNGGVGLSVSFTAGKLNAMDQSFGLLLTKILEEQLK